MLLNVAVALALAPAATPVRNVVAVPPPSVVPSAPGIRLDSAAPAGPPRIEMNVLCAPYWPVRPLAPMAVQPLQSVVPLGTPSLEPWPTWPRSGVCGAYTWLVPDMRR